MNTPKTDAAEMQYRYKEKRGDWEGEEVLRYVEPDFARDLETQVNELRKALTRLLDDESWDAEVNARAILEKTK